MHTNQNRSSRTVSQRAQRRAAGLVSEYVSELSERRAARRRSDTSPSSQLTTGATAPAAR
jgi:hypothetical protein